MAGVSGTAVTKACRKLLSAAVHGRSVDLDNADLQKFLARHDAAPTAPAKRTRKAPAAPTPPPSNPEEKPEDEQPPAPGAAMPRGMRVETQVVDDVSDIANWTIREVGQRFGTVTAFKDWLFALKTIEDVREKRLRNEEADGTLIPREPVKTYVFGLIDATNRRLLTDAARTLARRLFALAKSGATLEDGERTAREIIGSQLATVKT